MADIPALIAEGRRLIAAATDRKAKGFPSPLPWYVSGCDKPHAARVRAAERAEKGEKNG